MSAPLRTAVAAGALVVGTALGLLLGFRGPVLSPATTGDAALAADVRTALGAERGFQAVSAARVVDGRVTFAGLGDADGAAPGPDTPFELGSITKTFTAALLADAVARREVALDDPVSTQLPELAGTAAGASTYRQLATHTAGLPPFPSSSAPLVLLRQLGDDNPYAGSVADLLAATRTTTPSQPGAQRYSNLGVALLGHALARAARAPDWPTLLRQRVLDPLGMAHTVVVERLDQVPPGTAQPHHENGWPAPFWTGPAFAPAGSSTVTTARDLATWARALLDGTAPGASALDPVDVPGGRLPLVWQTDEEEGRTVTWHNGATGGSRTMLALDRDRGQGVLLLASSARSVDAAGLHLAATAPGTAHAAAEGGGTGWRGLLGWTVVGVLLLVTAVLRWRRPHPWALVDGALAAATGLLVLLAHGPWTVVPVAAWGGLLLATLALGVAAVRSPRPAGTPRRSSTVTSVLGTAAVLALAVWSL